MKNKIKLSLHDRFEGFVLSLAIDHLSEDESGSILRSRLSGGSLCFRRFFCMELQFHNWWGLTSVRGGVSSFSRLYCVQPNQRPHWFSAPVVSSSVGAASSRTDQSCSVRFAGNVGSVTSPTAWRNSRGFPSGWSGLRPTAGVIPQRVNESSLCH